MARSAEVVITNPVGLYAGPARQLVNFTKQFNSEIFLTYDGKSVNLKSLMGVVSLGIPNKAHVTVSADGYDEIKAVREIVDKMKEIDLIDE
jgi:phosphocarrier protein